MRVIELFESFKYHKALKQIANYYVVRFVEKLKDSGQVDDFIEFLNSDEDGDFPLKASFEAQNLYKSIKDENPQLAEFLRHLRNTTLRFGKHVPDEDDPEAEYGRYGGYHERDPRTGGSNIFVNMNRRPIPSTLTLDDNFDYLTAKQRGIHNELINYLQSQFEDTLVHEFHHARQYAGDEDGDKGAAFYHKDAEIPKEQSDKLSKLYNKQNWEWPKEGDTITWKNIDFVFGGHGRWYKPVKSKRKSITKDPEGYHKTDYEVSARFFDAIKPAIQYADTFEEYWEDIKGSLVDEYEGTFPKDVLNSYKRKAAKIWNEHHTKPKVKKPTAKTLKTDIDRIVDDIVDKLGWQVSTDMMTRDEVLNKVITSIQAKMGIRKYPENVQNAIKSYAVKRFEWYMEIGAY